MSKESKIKKRLEKSNLQKAAQEQTNSRAKLTPEQKAEIIKNSLANRPVIMFRYPNGRLNKRFIYTLALMLAALIASLIFLTR